MLLIVGQSLKVYAYISHSPDRDCSIMIYRQIHIWHNFIDVLSVYYNFLIRFQSLSSGYEPEDLDKKKQIDEKLIPELDDAVVRVATMRRKQPSKCKKIARAVANNSLEYYVSSKFI